MLLFLSACSLEHLIKQASNNNAMRNKVGIGKYMNFPNRRKIALDTL